eukprot:TRINITY_DN92719_c0_g1_i1.p1 TRINITY_DN92719_c0_g1~~TRINITY_DN92719_c0_g1_i1.p1  ORF type:complete len:224 (+),score=53.75 TRINITY_DN92719_c0_g1_i1:75-674(+)
MGNSPCFAWMSAQEVPEVLGPSGTLRKGSCVIAYQNSLWIPGTVTGVWSNGTVDLSVGDGGSVGSTRLQAKDVFLLEQDGNFFCLQQDGRPSYSKLFDSTELPFLLSMPEYGAFIRGLAVVVLLPEGERSGTVLSLRRDGLIDVQYEDGVRSSAALQDVFPLEAYYQQQASQDGGGDMLTSLIGGMAMDEVMNDAMDAL